MTNCIFPKSRIRARSKNLLRDEPKRAIMKAQNLASKQRRRARAGAGAGYDRGAYDGGDYEQEP